MRSGVMDPRVLNGLSQVKNSVMFKPACTKHILLTGCPQQHWCRQRYVGGCSRLRWLLLHVVCYDLVTTSYCSNAKCFAVPHAAW